MGNVQTLKLANMKFNHNILQNPLFAAILTLTGILIGLLLSILAVWADYESTSYGFMRRAQTPFQGLVCPVFIGKTESATVSIKVSNPTDRTVFPGVATYISTKQDFDSKIDHIQLKPGDHVTLQRTVGPQNIDLGWFILVDAQVYGTYPVPDSENTCGIFVLPVRNGELALLFWTTLSIVFMAAGAFLRYRNQLHARRTDSLLFVMIVTLLAMILGLTGSWLLALLMIVVALLTLLLIVGSFFQTA